MTDHPTGDRHVGQDAGWRETLERSVAWEGCGERSLVVLRGPRARYTDAELAALARLTAELNADYDGRWTSRVGANFWTVSKLDSQYPKPWQALRVTHEHGPFHATLADQVDFMTAGGARTEAR